MLERYFLRPATVDRIWANVAGAYREHYVGWLRAQGYAERNVFKRVPIHCQFGEFASARGAIDGRTALDHFAFSALMHLSCVRAPHRNGTRCSGEARRGAQMGRHCGQSLAPPGSGPV